MKKITLHRAATDNAGLFCDSGSTLTVSKSGDEGHITAERARDLLESHGAVEGVEEPAETDPAPAKAKASA
jgi:hypothetical protein